MRGERLQWRVSISHRLPWQDLAVAYFCCTRLCEAAMLGPWVRRFGGSGLFCVDFQDLDTKRSTLAVHSKFADGNIKINQMQQRGALKMLNICVRRGVLPEIQNCVT